MLLLKAYGFLNHWMLIIDNANKRARHALKDERETSSPPASPRQFMKFKNADPRELFGF